MQTIITKAINKPNCYDICKFSYYNYKNLPIIKALQYRHKYYEHDLKMFSDLMFDNSICGRVSRI